MFVHYIPILTTILSLIFFIDLCKRYNNSPSKTYYLVWAIGIATYGIGTALESIITIFGNTILLTKLWYVAGAILGGYPLAQGSVYFHFSKKTADFLSIITIPIIVILSVLVFLSPTDITLLNPEKPGGIILSWQWIRALTPIINLYAVIFLIGTAIYSAIRAKEDPHRAFGNWLIAIGAVLPGIGGAMAKGGFVEALYLGEFIGIILIGLGYMLCVEKRLAFPKLSFC